jgi:hypothetical protein
MGVNVLGVPQEEKALLKAFEGRRKQLQLEAMQMALKASEDARANYGKLELNPEAFAFAGSQMHSQLGPNPRLNGFTYDTSSESERVALALEFLTKALSGPAEGKEGIGAIGSPGNPDRLLQYGAPGSWDKAAALKRAAAGGGAEQADTETLLRSSRFGRPVRK